MYRGSNPNGFGLITMFSRKFFAKFYTLQENGVSMLNPFVRNKASIFQDRLKINVAFKDMFRRISKNSKSE
jgi:hypothetical protein